MCRIKKKLILFDYLVEKLADWQQARSYILNDAEVLAKFNSVRYMKLLYFTCLQSVPAGSETGGIENTLFDAFDNFVPLPLGPVEMDVYSNRSILPRYKFNGKHFEKGQRDEVTCISYSSVNDAGLSHETVMAKLIEDEGLSHYQTMIDKAVQELRQTRNFPFEDTDQLVNLSHSLKLWDDAVKYGNNKLAVRNIFELRKEKASFKTKLTTA